MSVCASWPIAASATTSSTGCHRGTEVRLRHPLPWQHHGHRHRWPARAAAEGLATAVAGHGGAAITAEAYAVATVVCMPAKGMKEPWCLAASTADEPARALINLYAKRWEIEGGSATQRISASAWGSDRCISAPDRRDRLWLINAFAVVLLTLLGAAGEQLGYDRHSRPTPPSGALIRSSGRGACFTNSCRT